MIDYENTGKANSSFADEFRSAFDRVPASGWFILGDEVRAFEREFAEYYVVSDCVGVTNGLDALFLPLKALGFKPGSEVLVPSNTTIANGRQPRIPCARRVARQAPGARLRLARHRHVCDSLLEANMFVQAIQHRQGYRIACLEEIAFSNGWIHADQLERTANAQGASEYGQYLREFLRELS